MDEHEKGVKLGLRAAASFIDIEADDLLERGGDKTRVLTLSVQDLTSILRRIASDVRELKVTRGR